MKTAISVPDDTFQRATRRAEDLGLSRSEFFSRAAEHYLAELDRQVLTNEIDAALEQLTSPDDGTAEAVAAGRRLLGALDDEW